MSDDDRIFPPHLVLKSEEERFAYYRDKATIALRRFVENSQKKLAASLIEDGETMTNLVQWWRISKDKGPPSGPREDDLPEIIEALRDSRNRYFANLRDLEGRIGRALLAAIQSFDEGPIQEARKEIRKEHSIKARKRILERRVLRALEGFYSEHQRVPTKGELHTELDSHPIEDIEIVVTRESSDIKITFGEVAKPVSKKQFREASSNLQLSDLPEGKPGNPHFSNRGEL